MGLKNHLKLIIFLNIIIFGENIKKCAQLQIKLVSNTKTLILTQIFIKMSTLDMLGCLKLIFDAFCSYYVLLTMVLVITALPTDKNNP